MQKNTGTADCLEQCIGIALDPGWRDTGVWSDGKASALRADGGKFIFGKAVGRSLQGIISGVDLAGFAPKNMLLINSLAYLYADFISASSLTFGFSPAVGDIHDGFLLRSVNA